MDTASVETKQCKSSMMWSLSVLDHKRKRLDVDYLLLDLARPKNEKVRTYHRWRLVMRAVTTT